MRQNARFHFYLTEIENPIYATKHFEDEGLLNIKIKEIDKAIETEGVIKFDAEMFDDHSLRIPGKSVIYYKIEKLKE